MPEEEQLELGLCPRCNDRLVVYEAEYFSSDDGNRHYGIEMECPDCVTSHGSASFGPFYIEVDLPLTVDIPDAKSDSSSTGG